MANRFTSSLGITTRIVVLNPQTRAVDRDLGDWRRSSGGTLDQEDIEYGEDPKTGGVRSRADMDFTRKFDDASAELDAYVETHAGWPVTMSQSRVGDDKLALGKTTVMTGSLKGSELPEADDTSSDRATYKITCRVDVATAVL